MQMLITLGTYEGGIVGYNYEKGSFDQLYGYLAHVGAVRTVASSSKQLATGGTDECVRLFDLQKLKENGGLTTHAASITSLDMNGDLLISGAQDGSLGVHELKGGSQWSMRLSIKAHKDSVLSVAIHPTGKLAISVSSDGSLKLWDLVRGTCGCVQSLTSDASSSLRSFPSLVRFSPSGDSFLLLYSTKLVLTSLADGKTLELAVGFSEAAFLTDHLLLVGNIRGEIATVSVSSDALNLASPLGGSPHASRIKGLQPVGDLLVSVCANGVIGVWDQQTLKVLDVCTTKAGRVTALAVSQL